MRKCLKPLIKLTDCDNRLVLNLGDCSRTNCNPDLTHLIITEAGCDIYDEVVEYKACEDRGFGCGTPICVPQVYITQVLRQKGSVIYPLHEMDCDGQVVFVLDDKLKTLGYGRYTAQVIQDNCTLIEFDIDYTCNSAGIISISTQSSVAMGDRC